MVLQMDQLDPVFDAVEGEDFGPNTTRQIRYTIRDFKKLLQRFLKGYITHEGEPWEGPFLATFSVWEDAAHGGTNQHQDTFKSRPPYARFSLFGGTSISAPTGNTSDVLDFFDPSNPVEGGACPLLPEGEDGEREEAHLVEFASAFCSVTFDLLSPAIEQARWAEATHVWLPFDVTMSAQHIFQYTCKDTPEVAGSVAGFPFSVNVLGIDYTAGGGGGFSEPVTGSFPVGDGTTSVYLWTPTGTRGTLDALETREGLDD